LNFHASPCGLRHSAALNDLAALRSNAMLIDDLKKARDLVADAAELIECCGDAEYHHRHGSDFEQLLGGLDGSIDELAGEEWYQRCKAEGRATNEPLPF
jgi:hypothetical protein